MIGNEYLLLPVSLTKRTNHISRPKINTYILSNPILIIYAWEEFQVALSFNSETLLTTLGILPLTVVGKELPHEPNGFVCPGARIFVQGGS